MLKPLRTLVFGLGVVAAGLAGAQPAYPAKPVHIVVPWAAGTGLDVFTRTLAKGLSERMGSPVVVENRVGAGGNVGVAHVARAPADGYTFVMGSNGPFAANPALYKDIQFDPIKDLSPVVLIGKVPMLLVANKDVQAASVDEVVALAGKSGNALNFGASNTTARVWVEYLKLKTNAKIETILYSNAGGMLTDLIGNQIQYSFENVGTSLPLIRTDKIKVLAVTSKERAGYLPNTPTVAESKVPDPELVVWFALFGPKGLATPVSERINREVNALLKQPEMQQAAEVMGMRIDGGSSRHLAEYHAAEVLKWRDLVKQTGIQIN
jgi:tripartite-type tricarboxylate transporter receptor subunit TctC